MDPSKPEKLYVGELLNGLCHGKGVMEYKNGGFYKGEWKHNKWDGLGTYNENGIEKTSV